jgi:hypothetical protein
MGRVVWVSQNGKKAGIQCPANHRQMNSSNSKYGSQANSQSKANKHVVFLVDI